MMKKQNPTCRQFTKKDFIWCLIGNILDQGTYIESNNEFEFNGTKHFSTGTKVYCSPFI